MPAGEVISKLPSEVSRFDTPCEGILAGYGIAESRVSMMRL